MKTVFIPVRAGRNFRSFPFSFRNYYCYYYYYFIFIIINFINFIFIGKGDNSWQGPWAVYIHRGFVLNLVLWLWVIWWWVIIRTWIWSSNVDSAVHICSFQPSLYSSCCMLTDMYRYWLVPLSHFNTTVKTRVVIFLTLPVSNLKCVIFNKSLSLKSLPTK